MRTSTGPSPPPWPPRRPGGTPQQILVALANATHVTRAIVDDTDFTVRAGLLADEIAATEPDLIGLQEVAWWRHGRSSSSKVGAGQRDR